MQTLSTSSKDLMRQAIFSLPDEMRIARAFYIQRLEGHGPSALLREMEMLQDALNKGQKIILSPDMVRTLKNTIESVEKEKPGILTDSFRRRSFLKAAGAAAVVWLANRDYQKRMAREGEFSMLESVSAPKKPIEITLPVGAGNAPIHFQLPALPDAACVEKAANGTLKGLDTAVMAGGAVYIAKTLSGSIMPDSAVEKDECTKLVRSLGPVLEKLMTAYRAALVEEVDNARF